MTFSDQYHVMYNFRITTMSKRTYNHYPPCFLLTILGLMVTSVYCDVSCQAGQLVGLID
jgi:hypothetical protein